LVIVRIPETNLRTSLLVFNTDFHFRIANRFHFHFVTSRSSASSTFVSPNLLTLSAMGFPRLHVAHSTFLRCTRQSETGKRSTAKGFFVGPFRSVRASAPLKPCCWVAGGARRLRYFATRAYSIPSAKLHGSRVTGFQQEFRSTKFDRPSYNDSYEYKTALRCIHRSVHFRFLVRVAPPWRNSKTKRGGITAGSRKSASRFSESLPLGCPG